MLNLNTPYPTHAHIKSDKNTQPKKADIFSQETAAQEEMHSNPPRGCVHTNHGTYWVRSNNAVQKQAWQIKPFKDRDGIVLWTPDGAGKD